ncbi:MAG: hypothetical protein GXO68_04395, partial [Crenarchaeota archaeon]|nr:hypothetical protein [Thermoproteota archaeon]
MKNKTITSFLLFTFLIATIVGAIPSNNTTAQTTPTLYIEKSQAIGINLQLNGITTLSQNPNTIADLMAGSFNNETIQQLYATRFDNGVLVWAKSAIILNNQDFVNSSFNALVNNIFLGEIIGSQRQSSLIMVL